MGVSGPNFEAEKWERLARATCEACKDYSIWQRHRQVRVTPRLSEAAQIRNAPQGELKKARSQWEMIWPLQSHAELPSTDLPDQLGEMFEEARAVYRVSPRSSVALLRLITEELLREVTDTTEKIDVMIGNLVQEGRLKGQTQQAADILRISGNDAVHPSEEMNTTEDAAQRADGLFKLVNLLVHQLITEPNEIADLYAAIPEGKRQHIAQRDAE